MSTIIKKIEALRTQIESLMSEREAPALAQASRAEIEATLTAAIEKWYQEGEQKVSAELQALANGNSGVDLMLPPRTAHVHHAAVVDLHAHARAMRALLTFTIGREAMLARFTPMLDAMPKGLDAEARTKRTADIERQMVELELREEDLLRDAEEQGINLDPRPGQRAEAAILIGYGQ